MNPFNLLKDIFAGKELEEENVKYFQPYILMRFISHDETFLPFCDLINQYVFTLPKQIIYKLFLLFLSGKSKYIKYDKEKKEKEILTKEMSKRIKRYYHWSEREFRTNFQIMIRSGCLLDTLTKTGFSKKDMKKVKEFYYEEN